MAAMAVGGCDASDAVRSDLLDVYDARRRLGDHRDYLTALRPRCDGPQTKRHGRFLSSPFLFVVACVLSLSWKTVLLHKELSRLLKRRSDLFSHFAFCLFDPPFLSSCVRVPAVLCTTTIIRSVPGCVLLLQGLQVLPAGGARLEPPALRQHKPARFALLRDPQRCRDHPRCVPTHVPGSFSLSSSPSSPSSFTSFPHMC